MITAILKIFDGLATDIEITSIKWYIESSSGKALDHIASIFRLTRLGQDDTTLRRRIKSIIAVNYCTGSINSIITALKILFESPYVRIINLGNGLMRAEVQTTDDWAVSFLNDVPAAGCKFTGVILWDENTFTFDDDNLGFDMGELA